MTARAPLHPEPRVDALWQMGLDARSPIICSAGRTGFYIDAVGNYWKCGAIASKFAPIGNILADGELKFASSAVCERYPTRQANPGAEIQCWCNENQVLEIAKASPKQLETLYDNAFFHIDVSRLCNFSCHYCTVSKPIFDARNLAKKREHLTEWERKPYMDKSDLELIAREIFAKCDNVQLRIAGMMEPLMNPDILAFFEVCRANIGKVKEIRLMSNLGIEKTFETILEMGFGKKLHTIVSMHVVDDNFDPFRVVRQVKRAEAMGTIIGSHIIPSPVVRETMIDYLDFFSLHGVRVRPVPYIMDDPSGASLEKGTQVAGHVPKHYRAMKEFLGTDFASRLPGKGYAAYVAQIRSLNADTYSVLEAFRNEGTEGEAGAPKRAIYMLKSEAPAKQVAPLPVSTVTTPAPAAAEDASIRAATGALVSDLRRRAMAAASAGDGEGALAHLESALRLAREDHEVLCDLATLALAHGDSGPAADFARQALQHKPDHASSLYTLGMALAQGGATAPAIATLRQVAAGDGAAALRAELGAAADTVPALLERLAGFEASAA